MAAKLLVYLSAAGVVVTRTRGSRITDPERFGNDEAGIESFRQYALANNSAPAFLLVDAIEEDYRFETLPHASGSDRDQMVERKLRQHYRTSQFSSAHLVGRDSTKRRDDRFLFCALTNPDLIAPWLGVLTAAGHPIGGVFLLPLVMPQLAASLEPKTVNLLFAGTLDTGVRLAFFREGGFRLSRLSRADTAVSGLPRAILDEITNTRLYLHALRAATLDEPATVILLDHADVLEPTVQLIHSESPALTCRLVGSAELAQRLKLSQELIKSTPESIFLQLLATKIPDSNLAAPAITAGYRRLRTRQQIYMSSAAVAVMGICWTGYNLLQQFTLDEERGDFIRQTARVNAEYEAVTRQFPSAPTSAENLKRTTELAEKLQAAGKTPVQFYTLLSRALAPDPDLVPIEITWQHSPNEITGTDRGTEAPTANRTGGPAAPPAPPPGTPPGSSVRKQSGLIAGELRNFRGDFRDAINRINRLADRLRADPAVEQVRVTQLPLNVNPGLALTGSTAETPAQGGSTEFRLIVVMKPAS
jgi:hypothetical protein